MSRISLPIPEIKDRYDVVVVGSGYGAGVAASRLARAGRSVCVLERGKEFRPGEYPDTIAAAALETQTDLPDGRIGSQTALFDLRINDDINVLIGCGLGGTSLINANVSLEPEPRVFDDPAWPSKLRDDVDGGLKAGFAHAVEMLKPVPYPAARPKPAKLAAHEISGAWLRERHGDPPIEVTRPPINVTFADGINDFGVEQKACTDCGDCVSGCNYGAKNTTLMNYLPDAANHGAEIFTEIKVRHLKRAGTRWLVYYQLADAGRERFSAPEMFVAADIVMLGAGTLGSTEILLRSRENGLPLSEQLGERFTGNGDVLAFAYNNDIEINGIGFGAKSPQGRQPVGPCITGLIDLRNRPELNDGMVMEEGSLPGAVAPLLTPAFWAGATIFGHDTDRGFGDFVSEQWRKLLSAVGGAYRGAMRNTQTFLVMAHDDGAGRMQLDADRLRVAWPNAGDQPVFERANERLREATQALGGTFVKNPIWSKALGRNLVTVHPLGGCVMAESAKGGVVDHRCRVFSGPRGAAVHDGLHVCDGAVIPRSLGVNPLLTITALAERCCALLARDRGWKISYKLPSRPKRPPRTRAVGIQFTETMRGHISTEQTGDYEAAAARGRQDGSDFAFTLTVASDDVKGMLADKAHMAGMVGTVVAPALSEAPLMATEGRFNLFVPDPEDPSARQMRYRMTLTAEDGTGYIFEGFKEIRDDPGFDIWDDTTTLYVTLRRVKANGRGTPVAAKGILGIDPADFAIQLTTIRATGAGTLAEAVAAQARFGRFFAGALYDVYIKKG